MMSYAFSKNISENGADSIWSVPTPFAPAGYNRGIASYNHTNILSTNAIWDIPVGKGHPYGSNLHPVLDGIIGGWEFVPTYLYASGAPLTFGVPGATLGNGFGTRANVVGPIGVSSPGPNLWFNPAAFAAPAAYQYGSSGIGIFTGPSSQVVNASLNKRFFFAEQRYVQLRWEAFNAFNHANYGNPNTTIGQGTTGKIFSAGPARQMQLGLKVVF
jgi:hypothetical protein